MNDQEYPQDNFAADANAFNGDSVFDNPQPRCPVALVLDTSYSMSGEPIEELSRGVNRFFEEIISDDFSRFSVETQIVTFGGRAKKHGDFISCASGTRPNVPTFLADGATPLGSALDIAMESLEAQKAFYKKSGIPYYQPWLIVMTDGEPTDSWRSASAKACQLANDGRLAFFGIGIGDYANMKVLADILPANRPPKKLDVLKFEEFFVWLSASMAGVSRSSVGDQVALPATTGWDSI